MLTTTQPQNRPVSSSTVLLGFFGKETCFLLHEVIELVVSQGNAMQCMKAADTSRPRYLCHCHASANL